MRKKEFEKENKQWQTRNYIIATEWMNRREMRERKKEDEGSWKTCKTRAGANSNPLT